MKMKRKCSCEFLSNSLRHFNSSCLINLGVWDMQRKGESHSLVKLKANIHPSIFKSLSTIDHCGSRCKSCKSPPLIHTYIHLQTSYVAIFATQHLITANIELHPCLSQIRLSKDSPQNCSSHTYVHHILIV
jgi:hypothetical protein